MPDLNALLHGVRYVVVGGTATSLYMPFRITKDVDILVLEREASKAEKALQALGAIPLGSLSFTSALGLGGTAWKLPDGTELYILRSAKGWVREALAHPNKDAASLPIVALPYLVLLKLDASRGMDIGDLSRMLGGASGDALDEVRAVVGRYLPDAAEDLESLIELGRMEFQPTIPITPEQLGPDRQPTAQGTGDVPQRGQARKPRRGGKHPSR